MSRVPRQMPALHIIYGIVIVPAPIVAAIRLSTDEFTEPGCRSLHFAFAKVLSSSSSSEAYSRKMSLVLVIVREMSASEPA